MLRDSFMKNVKTSWKTQVHQNENVHPIVEVIWWSEVVYYLHYTLEAFAKIDGDNWNV